MAKLYQEVYPFTTEMIAEYFSELDFKDKKVLTVGSSLDQAYNALLLGAKNIVVYDINENVKQFGKLKRKLILQTPRKKLYDEVLKIEEVPLSKDVLPKDLVYKINPYLKDDESYETLRRKLKEENRIRYITGDLTQVNNLDRELFDIIITSNVFQNIACFIGSSNPYTKLKEIFDLLKEHLTEEGILQLLYYYSFDSSDLNNKDYDSTLRNVRQVYEALQSNNLFLTTFKGITKKNDAILTYQKTRK